MPQFDPRHVPARYAPALMGCAAVLAVAASGVVATSRLKPSFTPAPTIAAARAPRPLSGPVAMGLQVRPGETLVGAVRRTGVATAEAREVVTLLSQAFDVIHIRAGLAFQALVTRPHGREPARLVALSMNTGPASQLRLQRSPDGGLSLKTLAEPVRDETAVASGEMRGSLYESAVQAGASPTLVAQATKLFAKKLDFARDIHPGDRFRLAFDRQVGSGGRTVSTGDLVYAEVGVKGRVTRFYRFEHDGKVQFLDEVGQQLKPLLLKTPLDGAHVTSAFGLRLHPILGYTRLHPGIDFGAPTGTPVYAAGDGVVEEARWAGGYGHWLKLRHDGRWETGYGHLSAYAKGVRPGAHVVQGQVVAYVGSTGLSTGPHLHYEVIESGRKIDPRSAHIPEGGALNAAEVADFHAQKAHIDAVLAGADAGGPGPAPAPGLRTAALR